jgi:lipopolysaccharide export system permease protein
VLCALAVYFGGYVVPSANRTKFSIEMNYLKKNISSFGSNIFFQDSKSRIVAISYFNEESRTAYKVSIQDFDPADLTRLVSRKDMEQLTYDSISGNWNAYSLTERRFQPLGEDLQVSPAKVLIGLNFKPKDLLMKQQKAEEMNFPELRAAIINQKNSGNDPTALQIEYHSRYAFAVTGFIVVLFGLPFSTNKRRGGLAVQVGLNILITFVYLVMLKVVQAFGINGSLNPLLTAWLVNALFLIAAIINLTRVKQ